MIDQVEQIRQTRKWGNSSGVLLPREWIGKQVKIVLIDRTEQIKKEVFDILSSYLSDIQGIYLVGSYARNEQDENSDIDIIAISNETKKIISSGKYNVQIYTLQGLRNTLKNYPISVYPSLLEAKAIMNQSLLEELKKTKVTSNSFAVYIKECRRVLNINEKMISIEKENGQYLKSLNVIYSAFLRLRGLYLMNSILNGINSTKKDFYKWIRNQTRLSDKDWENALQVYLAVRDSKAIKVKFPLEGASIILQVLKKELEKYGKPQKKTSKRN